MYVLHAHVYAVSHLVQLYMCIIYCHMVDDSSGSSLSHKKSDFIFGVRKRRKVHSVPLAFSSSYHGYLSSSKTRKSIEVREGTDVHECTRMREAWVWVPPECSFFLWKMSQVLCCVALCCFKHLLCLSFSLVLSIWVIIYKMTLSWWGQTSHWSLDSGCFELFSSIHLHVTCLALYPAYIHLHTMYTWWTIML